MEKFSGRKKSEIKTSGGIVLKLEGVDIVLKTLITEGKITKLIVSGVDENGNSLNVSPAYLKCPLSLLNEKNH